MRYARDLNNERPDEMNPKRVEEVCRALAEEFPGTIKVSVIGGEGEEAELVDQGLRMLSAVGQVKRTSNLHHSIISGDI